MNKEDYTLTRDVPPETPTDEIVRHTPFRIIPGGKDSPTSGLQPGDHEHRLKQAAEGTLTDFRIVPVLAQEIRHRRPNGDDRYTLHRGDLELQQGSQKDRRNLGMREETVIPRDARRLPQRDQKAKVGERNGRGAADMMHVSLTPNQRIEEIRAARKRTVTHSSSADVEKRDAEIIARLRESMKQAGIVPVEELNKSIASPAVKKHQEDVSVVTEGAKGRATYKEQPAPKKRELTKEEIEQLEESRAESDQKLIEGGAEVEDGVLKATQEQKDAAHIEMEKSLEDKRLTEETGKVLAAMDRKEIDSIRKSLNDIGMLGSDHQTVFVHRILDGYKKSANRDIPVEEAIKIMREGVADPSFPKEEEYQKIIADAAKSRTDFREPLQTLDKRKRSPETASGSYPNNGETNASPNGNTAETNAYTTFRTKAQLFTEDEKRAWEQQQISPTLQNDPHAVLDPVAEISGYFDRQSPEYLQLLDSYMKQEGMRTPMNNECEAVVCIPVYTLAEGQVIQHALEQYLYQIDPKKNKDAIDPKKFEIILFLNHPATKREELEKKLGKNYREGSEKRVKKGKPEVYDTEEVIQQFMTQHPELPIRVMKEEFEERVLWGQIIKPLYDIALRRAEERDNPAQADPLILTNDIDLVRMSPHYIRDVIDFFRKNEQEAAEGKAKKIDGAVGKIDLAPEGYRRVPELLLSKRFHSYLELQNTEYNHATHGRNTILRGSTLASIGGPCPYMDNGADGEMGGQIYYARGEDATTIPYLHKAWLETDPRRELKNLRSGVTLAHNWDTWAEMDIYDKNWTELQGDAFDPEKVSKDFLEAEINQTIQHPWYKHHNWGGRVERALSFIGLRNHEHELNKLIFEKGLSQESDEFRKALASFELTQDDYYWDDNGKLVLKNKDGHVDYHFVEENGQQKIVIDNIDHVKKKLSDYVEEERWNISQRKVDRVKPDESEQISGVQARIKRGAEVIRKVSNRVSNLLPSRLRSKQQKGEQGHKPEASETTPPSAPEEPPTAEADEALEDTETETADTDEHAEADAESEPESEAHPEKIPTDYNQTVAQYITQNNLELSAAEEQRFILYVKTNNRTDIEQAYNDFLKETAPEPKAVREETETSGNPLAEAALGMAAIAEQGSPQQKQEPLSQEVTEEMKQILQAGEQNNAEPWYREFVQDTETLKHMEKPGLFRSFSKEQMAQFDRIMISSLDRLSDISAYESDSNVLLKSASRNLEFAKAICQSNSPARRLLAEKIEDLIRDDFHAMHYMHEYERAVNANALSLFSVTKRDTSFYRGVLAAFFRNKELHPTELANVLGIPEVRDILKQAVLGMEIRSA